MRHGPAVPAPLVGQLLIAALTVLPSCAAAQGPVFRPLRADPKEPQFFAAYLWERSPRLAARLGSVGLGETVRVLGTDDWEVSLAAAVFSQFNLVTTTTDLLNTDYRVGLPLAYRRGAVAGRLQLYHQSSHLGDEYMAHTHAQRVDLTFEAVEVLVSGDFDSWRLYGGGDYLLTRSPGDLRPGVLHAGFEYRQRGTLLRLGRRTAGRLVIALDAKSFQDLAWNVGWSAVAGIATDHQTEGADTGWRWSLLAKAYTGPAPYGEFFRDKVSSLGLGIAVAP